jgi:hypothetical protein
MSHRGVRRVPATWQHPKDSNDQHIPLCGGSYSRDVAKWDEEAAQWENGFVRDALGATWEPKGDEHDMPFEEWHGPRPEQSDYMPDWPSAERTHYQMYEDTSEGMPISPVMDSPEALAQWLADHNETGFGAIVLDYEDWLVMINAPQS